MKTLIVLRHGHYTGTELTKMGREQVQSAIERLLPFVNGKSVRMFASPSKRTEQSAEIVGQRLGIPFQLDEAIRDRYDDMTRDVGALLAREQDSAEVLILVTHQDYLQNLAGLFIEGYFHTNDIDRSIPFAGIAVIDVDQKSVQFL